MINRETHARMKEALTKTGGYSSGDAAKIIKAARAKSKELHGNMKKTKGKAKEEAKKKMDKRYKK